MPFEPDTCPKLAKQLKMDEKGLQRDLDALVDRRMTVKIRL